MNAPDLVLLHGALGARSQLAPLAEALRPAFRVHLLDFEGHGDAPPPDHPFGVDAFGANVLALLDAAGVGRARFFGYSMGGYVALHLAATHPHRVERIATLGTKFRWDADTAAREAARLDPVTIRAKVPRFADALVARHAGAGGWERVLAATADFLHDLGARPALTDAVLRCIPHPVRVIVGDRDATVSVEESAAAAESLPAAELTVLPDTPHPIEQVPPERLAPILLDFLGTASPGR